MSLEILAQKRIRAIIDELQDVRSRRGNLVWVNRVPLESAEDNEIMARYTGRVTTADIIADDQAAVVKAANPITVETNKVPNLKHGAKITQAQLNLLGRIQSNLASARDTAVFENYVVNTVTDLVDGVNERIEALIVAMLTDAFTYNRLGIQIANATWGMPSDLKVTVGTVWTDTANATPITDIQSILRVGREKYGVNLNRLTMTTVAFMEMVNTTQFRNMAQLYSSIAFPAATFPVNDVRLMSNIAGMILGADIEIYDKQVWTEALDGTTSAANVLDTGKVLLTTTALDGNRRMADFANGVVTESLVAPLANMPFGGFSGPEEGPTGYVTCPNVDLNPPNLTLWGVARGWPRKHNLACSAVLTI